MPIVAFTFGSLGDLLSLAALVQKVLCSSTGASYEYQELVKELDLFIQTVRLVQDALFPGGLGSPLPTSVERGLWNALLHGHTLLKGVRARIASYQHSLGKNGSGNMVRDTWLKMGWGFFKESELRETRAKIRAQIDAIHTLLALSQCQSLERLEDRVNAHEVTLSTIHSRLEELPKQLGSTWEGGSTQRFIVLTDILGTDLFVPMDFCQAFDIFHNFLKFYYRTLSRAGAQYVERGDYDLALLSDELQIVDSASWDMLVQPGIKIVMNAVLHLDNVDIQSCPSCKTDNTGARTYQGGISCRHCQTWFRVSDSYIEEVGDERAQEPVPSSGPSQRQRPSIGTADDARFLRRIRVIRTRAAKILKADERTHPNLMKMTIKYVQVSEEEMRNQGVPEPFTEYIVANRQTILRYLQGRSFISFDGFVTPTGLRIGQETT